MNKPLIIFMIIILTVAGCKLNCNNSRPGACPRTQNNTLSTNSLKSQWLKIAGAGRFKKYPQNPILSPGKGKTWDAWALMSMTILEVNGTYHMYYEAGATGLSDLKIGHAVSKDTINWTPDKANPVLGPGPKGQWDSGGVWDPFVIYEDGIFKMWYGGERIDHRDFQCGYATSKDGTNFVKHQKITNFPRGEIGDMHVFHDKKSTRYYMYYWDRRFETAQRLKVAISENETDFDFDNARTIRIEGEKPGHRYSHVFKILDQWYMFYSFENKPPTGCAISSDGIHWKLLNNNILNTEDPEILVADTDIILMYYCPPEKQDEPGCDIRLAVMKGRLKSN